MRKLIMLLLAALLVLAGFAKPAHALSSELRALLLSAGKTPFLLRDLFSRYTNGANMDGAVPLIGPAWHATGPAPPTVQSGLLQSSGTGYLATSAFVSQAPKLVTASVAFSGGADLTQQGMTFGLSPDTPFALNNLLHFNFGPQAFNLFITVGGGGPGSFINTMSGSWSPAVSNNGVPHTFMLALNASSDGIPNQVVSIIGPNGEVFSVNDPGFAALAGKTVFLEPNLQADGLQALVASVYAKKLSPIAAITPTTFNPSDKLAGITLSNGNLTATANANAFPNGARSIAGRTNGKVHVEFTLSNHQTAGSQNLAFGISSLSQHALNAANGLGGDLKSFAIYPTTTNTTVFLNNAGTNLGAMGGNTGDTWAMEIDFGLMRVWFKNVTQATGWNNDILANQNPATGTGGFNFSTMGGAPYGITVDVDVLNDAITINTGGSAYAQTPSAGFGNWL